MASTLQGDFVAPAASSGIKWADFTGRLLLISPLSVDKVQTAYGESEAVRANIVVVDGPDAGEEHRDVLIFPRVLVSQTRPALGKKVVGRLGTGQAKPGQSAPWMLSDPTDADISAARAVAERTTEPPF